jgi:hypothetical protein
MDEQTKQQVLFAVIAMALTVTIYQIGFNSGFFAPFGWVKLIVGLLIGAAVGGAVFGVMKAINR